MGERKREGETRKRRGRADLRASPPCTTRLGADALSVSARVELCPVHAACAAQQLTQMMPLFDALTLIVGLLTLALSPPLPASSAVVPALATRGQDHSEADVIKVSVRWRCFRLLFVLVGSPVLTTV